MKSILHHFRRIKPVISDIRKPKAIGRSVDYRNLIEIPTQNAKIYNAVFGTVNARSLRKNLDDIKTIVSQDSIDILSITGSPETILTKVEKYVRTITSSFGAIASMEKEVV